MTQYEPVIGLEVHCQLKTNTKLFCGCSAEFGATPNAHTCPVCLGMPGALPVMNRLALRHALVLGTALDCTIRNQSRFARKNYFYPDSPKGYQVSQFAQPILEAGSVPIEFEGEQREIVLTRIHLEEDAGKSVHLDDRPVSYVDLNRCGTPLVEIVSEPVIRGATEAAEYLKELRNIVRYLGISDGHMEQGSFRCDANISIRPVGQQRLGTRVELKNLNSFNHVKRAIEYEIERQGAVLDSGDEVVQETRLWDDRAGLSRSMRTKEEAHDYRYFPEPDLLPLVVSEAMLAEARDAVVELPHQRRARYRESFQLTAYDADVLTSEKELSEYFEAVVAEGVDPKVAANWVQGELRGRLNADGLGIERSPVSASVLSCILLRLADNRLSGKLAKQVFGQVYSGQSVESVLEEVGEQITDVSAIESVIAEVLSEHGDEVQTYLDGKTKVFGFFVGQVMKATRGKANPGVVSNVLRQQLENMKS